MSADCPVSVILPVYNSEDTIKRSLDGVLNQTRKPLEILCINDCSTDNSKAVIEQYTQDNAEAKNRIKLINLPENGGVYVARNVGLNTASQPYVAYLDADDFWHPRKLETQFNILEQDPDLFFISHQVHVWPEKIIDLPRKWPDVDAQTMRIEKINPHFVTWFSRLRTISVVMKNDPKYRFDESKRRAGDTLMWLEVIWNGEKSRIIQETLGWKAKEHFGAGGLSGHLKKAQAEAQHNVSALEKKGLISKPYAFLLHRWGDLRYLKRKVMVALRG